MLIKYDLENRIKELDENIKNLLEESAKEPIDKTLEKLPNPRDIKYYK